MSRGGEKGGSRVYLFLVADDDAGVVNCEVKDGVTADREKLRVGLEVAVAYKKGMPVFEEPPVTHKPRKSKTELQTDLRLNKPPDGDFMRLLAEAGDEDVVTGPALGTAAREYTPDALEGAVIEGAVIEGAVGILLAHARRESGRSLADIGAEAGVTRARIQQIERSENIEIATLVRIAAACGYQVSISLRPLSADKRGFAAVLGGIGT